MSGLGIIKNDWTNEWANLDETTSEVICATVEANQELLNEKDNDCTPKIEGLLAKFDERNATFDKWLQTPFIVDSRLFSPDETKKYLNRK